MIVANMATFPARENGIEEAVRRISAQVDQVNLCLNEFERMPKWVGKYPNLNAVLPTRDLKDLGKFMFEHEPDDQVFLVDDDIAYPSDYVTKTLDARQCLKSASLDGYVVGYHGTIYLKSDPIRMIKDALKGRGFSKPDIGRAKILHPYYKKLGKPRIVTQVGTGTAMLSGAQMPSLEYMLGAERRADVRFAKWCHTNNLPIVILPRACEWMPCAEGDTDAIWTTYTSKSPTEFVNELKEFAFDVPGRGKWIHT